MPGYHDVHVLAPERSAAVANRFLAAFAPNREETTAEYAFPRYSAEPSIVFETAAEAIRYCIERPEEAQSLYFSNRNGKPAWVMLFFTTDAALILGVSVESSEEDVALAELQCHAGSEIGYITFESPPADTAAEFRRIAEESVP